MGFRMVFMFFYILCIKSVDKVNTWTGCHPNLSAWVKKLWFSDLKSITITLKYMGFKWAFMGFLGLMHAYCE